MFKERRRPEPKIRMNQYIRVPEVAVIDSEGKNLGVMPIEEALRIAQDQQLDLVEVGPNAKPPITKIIDYGKYLYQKEKKEKEQKSVKVYSQETKSVQVGFKTGQHDLEIRAGQIDKFLEKGYRVRIELRLRGREKGMAHLGRQKLEEFLKFIKQPFAAEDTIKSSPSGFNIQIKSDKTKNHA